MSMFLLQVGLLSASCRVGVVTGPTDQPGPPEPASCGSDSLLSAPTPGSENTVNMDQATGSVRLEGPDGSASFVPMKALGMVIFSHIRSRTSRPEEELAIALTTAVMSLWTWSWFSS